MRKEENTQEQSNSKNPAIFLKPEQLKKLDFILGDMCCHEQSSYINHLNKILYHYMEEQDIFDKDEISNAYLKNIHIIEIITSLFEWYQEVEKQKILVN